VCTLALARLKHYPVSPVLAAELDRITTQAVYDRRVLFIDHLGFITRTPVRRIELDEALHFEQLHRDAYRELGYDLIPIPPAPPAERAAQIIRLTTGATP
jgi:predicted ATPase